MRLLVIYSHFSPAFKAGGPVQSLSNLCEFLAEKDEVFVFCGSRDLGENRSMSGIVPNTWQRRAKLQVYYADGWLIGKVRQAYRSCRPEVVYVNGMFLPVYNWYVLWLARKNVRIVAPRGMLQKGALALKTSKKRFMLKFLRCLGLYSSVRWHATDRQESDDIRREIDMEAEVHVIPNLTRKPLNKPRRSERGEANLRLVYLSLVTVKKNLHMVTEVIRTLPDSVTLDIFGPIIDEDYWNDRISPAIKQLKGRVTYHGAVQPQDVQSVLTDYDAFILPTSGENFGHAIYEALSVGLPVITSRFTPWPIDEAEAGKICELNPVGVRSAIEFLYDLSPGDFDAMSERALQLAARYYKSLQPDRYHKLFTRQNEIISDPSGHH